MSDTMDYSLFADLYDAYVRTELDIPFFLQEARRVGGEVLELMSGTGRVSLPLLEAGVRLTCVDASPDMLQILRQKVERAGLAASLFLMDVRLLYLGRQFDLIFIPFHAFAELHSPADRLLVLEKIHQHLAEDGRFICTLHNPVVRLKRVDGQYRLWSSTISENPPGKLLVWGLENYDAPATSVHGMQFFESYDSKGQLTSKRMVEFRFRIIERGEFEAMAENTGFVTEALFGDYNRAPYEEFTSPFMIWKLRKR